MCQNQNETPPHNPEASSIHDNQDDNECLNMLEQGSQHAISAAKSIIDLLGQMTRSDCPVKNLTPNAVFIENVCFTLIIDSYSSYNTQKHARDINLALQCLYSLTSCSAILTRINCITTAMMATGIEILPAHRNTLVATEAPGAQLDSLADISLESSGWDLAGASGQNQPCPISDEFVMQSLNINPANYETWKALAVDHSKSSS